MSYHPAIYVCNSVLQSAETTVSTVGQISVFQIRMSATKKLTASQERMKLKFSVQVSF